MIRALTYFPLLLLIILIVISGGTNIDLAFAVTLFSVDRDGNNDVRCWVGGESRLTWPLGLESDRQIFLARVLRAGRVLRNFLCGTKKNERAGSFLSRQPTIAVPRCSILYTVKMIYGETIGAWS